MKTTKKVYHSSAAQASIFKQQCDLFIVHPPRSPAVGGEFCCGGGNNLPQCITASAPIPCPTHKYCLTPIARALVSEPVPGEAGLSACQRPDRKPGLAIPGHALARGGQVISAGSRHVTNVMLTAIAREGLPDERPWPQRKLGSLLQALGGGGGGDLHWGVL